MKHCCEAGEIAWPESCPWHPPAPLQEHETITACSRCDGTGNARLHGAERIRAVMDWPREQPDAPCAHCSGQGVEVIDKEALDARLKAKREHPANSYAHRSTSPYAHIFDRPQIQLPKDFA